MIGLLWSATLGWAQLNSSVHWRGAVFHLSRALAKFRACCKLQGRNNLLSKYCSRPRVKPRSWLLITLQLQGWQQEKLSVSNHLHHTCEWEKKDEYLPASYFCWNTYLRMEARTYFQSIPSPKQTLTVLMASLQQPRAVNSPPPNLWGDLLDLWSTPQLLSCSCTWGSGFPPLEVTVGKGYCTPRSHPSRESSYIQGGHSNSSFYLSDVVSKWGTVTSTRSMTFPGSKSCSDGEYIKHNVFNLGWSGRRKVCVQLNAKITLLLFEFSYSEWSTHHGFTSSGKGT